MNTFKTFEENAELEKIAKSLDTPEFRKKHGKDWMSVKMAIAHSILKKRKGIADTSLIRNNK